MRGCDISKTANNNDLKKQKARNPPGFQLPDTPPCHESVNNGLFRLGIKKMHFG